MIPGMLSKKSQAIARLDADCREIQVIKVSIYRYYPDTDDVPYMRDYDLELDHRRDMMVLDLLETLNVQDPTLTYRRSCREGVTPALYPDPITFLI